MLKEYILPTIIPLATGICDPHFHDAVEVMLVLKGSGRVCYNGVYHDQPTGSVLFVSPQVIHSYDNRTEDFEAIALFVEMNRIADLVPYSNDLYPSDPVWVNPEMDHPIWALTQATLASREELDAKSTFIIVCGIINEILKCYTFTKPTHQGTSLQRLLEYCQNHYQEPLSVGSLAAALSLSEGHISHLFTYRLHQSFPDYINALRTNEAIRLLRNPKISISDICTSCGFNSIRTFNRAFLKQYGISPSQYRKDNAPVLPRTTA